LCHKKKAAYSLVTSKTSKGKAVSTHLEVIAKLKAEVGIPDRIMSAIPMIAPRVERSPIQII